jgi:thymidylate synthase (FAD)
MIYIDCMNGHHRIEKKIDEHGFLALVDVMPRLIPEGRTADYAIVQAARVSYGEGTKTPSDDRTLIRYLMRHRHTTPFEMVEMKFHISLPMFIARQWIRHRTANVNEYSARYSVVPDAFWKPDSARAQGISNKQAGEGSVSDSAQDMFLEALSKSESIYSDYEKIISSGICREQARAILPVSAYTQWYWKCDLHNIFNFLSLRMDSHAQQEIRDYAIAMFEIVKAIFPISCEAFEDYRTGAVYLTRLEADAIRSGRNSIDTANKRESEEWKAKMKILGIENKNA